ncbi:MAG: hypothetical protein F7C34_05130 [Desulfurococcales archaeon]|nr:hypothetical protein [Desulfurococcales archaeon]
METPLCTACKRRPAVYKRTYSGELLCARCTRKALHRAVKRSIARLGLLKPRQKILVPLASSNPLGSLVLASALSEIEEQYGSRVILGVPEGIDASPPRGVSVAVVRVSPREPPERGDPVACWRHDRRWSLRAARILGADAVLLPLTRTDLNLLLLEALLRGEPQALSEALHSLAWTKPPIASGLWRVEGELVAAYAAISGVEAPPGCVKRLSAAKEVYYSAASGRPELEYSPTKSLDALAAAASGMYPVCIECGGYASPGESTCRYCSRYTLNVSILSLRE